MPHEFYKCKFGKFQKQNYKTHTIRVWGFWKKFDICATGNLSKFGAILLSFASSASLSCLARVN